MAWRGVAAAVPLPCGLSELLTGELQYCGKLDLEGVTANTNVTANYTLSLLATSLATTLNGTATERLRTLLLSGNEAFGDDAPARLAPVLATHPTLQHLSLDECNVSQHGAQLLADALQQGSGLVSLSLSYNSIGEAGVAALASALPGSSLRALHLRRSAAGAEGAAALASSLGVSNTSLR